MKKIKYTLLFLFVTTTVQAQIYINAFSGYSFATNPEKSTQIMGINRKFDITNRVIYYGKGLNLGFGVGYIFNKHLSAELSYNTQAFTKSEFDHNWAQYDTGSNYYFSGIYGEGEIKNKSAQLAPLLVYTININKIHPYIKVGPNLLKVKTVSERNYTSFPRQEQTKEIFVETVLIRSGEWKVGFRGAFGAFISISEKLQVYGELLTVNMHYAYNKEELIKYKEDGIDLLSTQDKVSAIDEDRNRIDYSHFGFNLGVKYLFIKN